MEKRGEDSFLYSVAIIFPSIPEKAATNVRKIVWINARNKKNLNENIRGLLARLMRMEYRIRTNAECADSKGGKGKSSTHLVKSEKSAPAALFKKPSPSAKRTICL